MLWPEFSTLRRAWGPWNDMRQLQREADRLFSGRSVPYGQGFPAVNLWFKEDNAILTSEIPGLDPSTIDITVKDDLLTLQATRVAAELREGDAYHRQERGHGKFTRTVRMPFQIDNAKVTATYEKGVLKIELPRAEADKPKKIQIKAQ